MSRDAYILAVEYALGALLWPIRRWWRAGIVLLCAATAMKAQSPADSLIGTVLSRAVIPPQWQGGDPIRVWCLTWVSEVPERPHVLIVIDAAPADTTLHPLCPNPRGGNYPLWIDGPVCPPGQASPFTDRDFILVRCGVNAISRYRRPVPVPRGTQ